MYNNIVIVEPSFEIATPLEWIREYPNLIEKFGRTCYKSEDRITPVSANKFIKSIVMSGHLSVIEHLSISVKIIIDRGSSQQVVRHRIAAYSQESQRYVNYKKKGYSVCCPRTITEELRGEWMSCIQRSIDFYEKLVSSKIKPEDARSVLPMAMKTELIATYNLRTWRHIFEERALNPRAQWEIRGVMRDVLRIFAELLPEIFEDQLEALKKLEEKERK